MSEIIDISRPLADGMPVYPGTTGTKIATVKSGSGTSALSEISFTSHAGTHVDAPSHSLQDGVSIDELPLSLFYGSCRVLDLTGCVGAVAKSDLLPYDIQRGERILLKTSNSLRGFATFYDDYIYVAPDAAQHLSDVGVALVGIDSLSIKQRGAKDNTSHTALLSKNIAILEGLNLQDVDAGSYELCAFPLAFQGLDGSPVRAVLII